MAIVLVSPLGRSPGAVSGVYFSLKTRGESVSTVVTVGTSHADVMAAARNYLKPLFDDLGVVYDAIHLPEEDLRSERRVLMPYVSMMGLAIHNAREAGNEVHVSVTAGRSGMGAVAALAAQYYGADYLWSLWVPAEIEQGSTVDQLQALVSPTAMENSPFLNPTVWGETAWDLIRLPFVNLSPLEGVLDEYRRTGKIPDPGYFPIRVNQTGSHISIDDLLAVFPPGMTFGQGHEYVDLMRRYYLSNTVQERDDVLVDLGMFLARTGIIESSDRKKLRDLLRPGSGMDQLTRFGKKDHSGFWQWFGKNKDQFTTISTLLEVLLKSVEIWLKFRGVIS